MLSLDSIVQPAAGVVTNTAGEELVVVLPEQAKFLVLNSTGAQLWRLADGGHSLGEIAGSLAGTFHIDVARAQADVLQIAAQLVAREVLVLGDGNRVDSSIEDMTGQD